MADQEYLNQTPQPDSETDKMRAEIEQWLDNMDADLDILEQVMREKKVRSLPDAKFSLPAESVGDLTMEINEDLHEIAGLLSDPQKQLKVRRAVQTTILELKKLGSRVRSELNQSKSGDFYQTLARLGADLPLLQALYEQKINYYEDTTDTEPEPKTDLVFITLRLFPSSILAVRWMEALKRNAPSIRNLSKALGIAQAAHDNEISLEQQLMALTLRVGVQEYSPLLDTGERERMIEAWHQGLLADKAIWQELLQADGIVVEPSPQPLTDEAAIEADFAQKIPTAFLNEAALHTVQEAYWAGSPATFTGEEEDRPVRQYFESFLGEKPDVSLFSWVLDAILRQHESQQDTFSSDVTPQLFPTPEDYQRWLSVFEKHQVEVQKLATDAGLTQASETELKLLALSLRLGIQGESPYQPAEEEQGKE